MRIFDLQKALNKEFNYLFSLNKLGVATDIRYDNSDGLLGMLLECSWSIKNLMNTMMTSL